MIEIEKRYRINGEIPFDLVKSKIYIEQCYSNIDPDCRIRYIKSEDEENYFHTTKYQLKNNQREEIEVEITKEQYNRIFDVINKKPVRKNRYIIDLDDNLTAEVDEFLDTGDIIVEVEFESEDQMKAFIKPSWIKNEIKGKQSFNIMVFSKLNRMVGDNLNNSLISEQIAIALENLMGMFFQMNRILDRCSSQLSVKFVMPNTTEIVHKKWSHLMPLIGDKISNYCDDRNYAVSYPETTKDYTEYENLTDMFSRILDYMLEIEDNTIKGINLANQENDLMTKHFLEKFLYEDIRPYTKLAQNFVDYIDKNGDEPSKHMNMDARINRFLSFKSNEEVD